MKTQPPTGAMASRLSTATQPVRTALRGDKCTAAELPAMGDRVVARRESGQLLPSVERCSIRSLECVTPPSELLAFDTLFVKNLALPKAPEAAGRVRVNTGLSKPVNVVFRGFAVVSKGAQERDNPLICNTFPAFLSEMQTSLSRFRSPLLYPTELRALNGLCKRLCHNNSFASLAGIDT